MQLIEIQNNINDTEIQLQYGLAILNESVSYFDKPNNYNFLPIHAEHIGLLLDASGIFISNALNDLEKLNTAISKSRKGVDRND